MDNYYISIGTNCTTPTLFEQMGVKKESLPFDWMFSTPEFVYEIIKQLLVDKLEIKNIVDNDFFICDKRAIWFKNKTPDHYINTDNGDVLINSKFNVAFPHDTLSNRDTYIRRLERMRDLLLNQKIFIYFVYISIPNPTSFMVNGIHPIKNLYDYMEKLNKILKDIRTNYKILIFDTNKPPLITNFDSLHVEYHDIEKKDSWIDLIPDVINKLKNSIKTQYNSN
jgi:hypothetical protein